MLETTVAIPGAVPLSQSAGVTLRELRLSDLRKLAWWYNHTVPPEARYYRYRGVPDMHLRLLKLAGRDSCHRAILSNGRLVGYCRWNDHMEAFIFIGRPEYRGRGIGTKAMRHLLYEFKRAGRWCMTAKTARPDFWFKLGFRELAHDWRLTDEDKALGRIMLLLDRRQHHGNG